MANAVARAYNGGLGRSPSGAPGQVKPPKAQSFLAVDIQWRRQNCYILSVFCKLLL